jgi:hypothetical protein
MKDKVSNLIKTLGLGLNELVFDFEIDGVKFNSIEWLPEEDKVLLHIFEDEEIDKYCNEYKVCDTIIPKIEYFKIILINNKNAGKKCNQSI